MCVEWVYLDSEAIGLKIGGRGSVWCLDALELK